LLRFLKPWAALTLLLAPAAAAQEPRPTPTPIPPREQDELDFGRLSLSIGSGARAFGMGGAFLARPDDATAASWNPAGLSYLRLPEVSLVGLFNSQNRASRTVTEGEILRDHVEGTGPDFASMALPVNLGLVSGAVQLSLQRVIPYGGERTIEDVRDPPKVIHGTGGFDVLALGTGLKVNRWVRVGVTVNRWFNGYQQERERLGRRRSIQEVDFSISGYSVNGGLIVHPLESLNLGVVAKTRMKADVDLFRSRMDFVTDPGQPDIVTTNSFRSDEVQLDLPGALGFGVSWRPSSPLTLSADYTQTYWSRARVLQFFTLPPGVSTMEPQQAEVFPSLPFPTVVDQAQSDTKEWRVGVEYVLIPGRLKIPLRAGYFQAQQIRLVKGLSPRHHGLTAGAGFLLGPLALDAAYVNQSAAYTDGVDEQGFAIRSRVRLHSVLVSIIYRHGAR
jgi:hypothetical protein